MTGTRIQVAVTLTFASLLRSIKQVSQCKTEFHLPISKEKQFTKVVHVKVRTQVASIHYSQSKLTHIFRVSFTNFISSSLYPFERTDALWENKLKAYCTQVEETEKITLKT